VVNVVFEFKEAVISYEASGSAGSCLIKTDMPSWGTRETISLPVTSGGKGVYKDQVSFEGRHLEVEFTAGAGASDVLKPYEMHLMVRRIGLHLSNGETYSTGQLPIAIG
jgi:hypothetical protein